MQFSASMEGMEELQKKLAKFADPANLFDAEMSKAARQSVRSLIETTPKSGHGNSTMKGWSQPQKRGPSNYLVDNKVATMPGRGGKIYSLPVILDSGRGEVLPQKTYLFIPLTERARAKRPGVRIPKEWVRASKAEGNYDEADYLFTKRVKPFVGTKFIQKELTRSRKQIVDLITEKIRKT